MSGVNRGSVFVETFGTTSPVKGDAPSGSDDGQPLDGLAAITVVVTAAPGVELAGGGVCDAYYTDPALTSPDGAAVSISGNVTNVPYDTSTAQFINDRPCYDITSGGSFHIVRQDGAANLWVDTIVGSIVNNNVLAMGMADVDGTLSASTFLDYDHNSSNFTVGQVCTGATSGATGTITANVDAGATGTLTLSGISGTFLSAEALSDPLSGPTAATANGTQYKTLSYKNNPDVGYSTGLTVYGITSSAHAVIQLALLSGATGVLHLKTITGAFVDGEHLPEGHGLVNGSTADALLVAIGGNFEAGQIATGQTSGATATIASAEDVDAQFTALNFENATLTGDFVEDRKSVV